MSAQTEELTVKVNLANLPYVRDLAAALVQTYDLTQKFAEEAGKSVEYSDWPEMQCLVSEADEVKEKVAKLGLAPPLSYSNEQLLDMAPGEYTDWEKRIWRRGYLAAIT